LNKKNGLHRHNSYTITHTHFREKGKTHCKSIEKGFRKVATKKINAQRKLRNNKEGTKGGSKFIEARELQAQRRFSFNRYVKLDC